METLGLAIDTTFDDTSVALLRGTRQVLSNKTLSQYKDHEAFGGVIPERASRRHLEVIHPLIQDALKEGGAAFDQLDWIAVSHKPGLLGSILVGLTVAKSLAFLLNRPLIGINHIEAHPYANFLGNSPLAQALANGQNPFPLLHLVAAGGHTLLIYQRDHFQWEIVGRSLDDAAGECVDKAAKMFGHPMPGGPVVDRLAMAHPPGDVAFPRPLLNDPGLDFSFSGLKTALRYHLEAHPQAPEGPTLAAYFQAVCDVLTAKTLRAARRLKVERITLSGGLCASQKLREEFRRAADQEGLELFVPPPALCTDNAAMVACLGAFRHQAGRHDSLALDGESNLLG
ncbi:MAG: tRNA (adenosine(37)-N6)-threonylcarbamoyltransferase complex transferase subunit TsaD [Deltaproteobacteria bacterium]|nr:tRNA (adenosine(37)-N6)-threonylcarbamoyltransferase complex transferase subunit TsaD [Deltaproteobacteria bacterium]MDH4122034.1 tRNA (adenosine(37)-N6)-threonylcarbamoyltransferase complex transferase subunit TsaD [Deltaproteobacteria bacterium]